MYQNQKVEVHPVIKKFVNMGARARINNVEDSNRFVVDVGVDRKGEFFDITKGDSVDLYVLDIDSKDRHLLLMGKSPSEMKHQPPEKVKVLCGHDEREWFSSQVRGIAVNVDTAKQALKPEMVIESQNRHGVKSKNKHKRKNKGFVRQGEWFFIPINYLEVPEDEILSKEPLFLAGVRAGTKPHIAELAYRRGGEQVYVPNIGWNQFGNVSREESSRLQAGITNDERKQLYKDHPKSKKWSWRPMVRNPELYIKGYVRHPDHKTIVLNVWHRVVVNGEIRGENVVFLD